MKFSDLKFGPRPIGPQGIQAKVFFENGYGASVVKFPGSYGYDSGLYELAVLKGTKRKWDLCYNTKITEDVLGHLSEDEVTKTLIKIEKLKRA